MKRRTAVFVFVISLVAPAILVAGGGPEIPRDEDIKENIVDQLVWDNRVDASEVKVEVESGEVTLTGTVPTFFAQEAVVDDVWDIDGVTSVDNELTIQPSESIVLSSSLAESVKNVLDTNAQIDATRITVSVTVGRVVLEGTVDALWQKLQAEKLASGMSGVVDVTNEIAVVPGTNIVDEVVAQNIVDAIDRNVNVDIDNVDVTVTDGHVTLAGTVGDWSARDAAYRAAANTVGAKDITDHIVVEPVDDRTWTDAEIADAVRSQLIWDDQVDASDIDVSVSNGHVILTGTVSTYSAKVAARNNARTIAGVVSVENQLAVRASTPSTNKLFLARRADNIITWSTDIDAENIDIDVEAGVATLSGEVDALWKKRRVEELVADVEGMVGVINEIAVVPTENPIDEAIAEDIVDALDRSVRVDVDSVTVEVQNAIVTLAGVVPSYTAHDAAFRIAQNTSGVVAVINNIDVAG